MRLRFTAASLAAIAVGLTLVAGSWGAMVGIYRNSMESISQRGQLVKLSGGNCTRGGSNHALRVAIGKRTTECSYRTPVIGRDLEIAATERLLSGTPTALQRKMFLGLELRAGGGARYQLAVYPLQQKVQLRKYFSDGSVKYLAIVKEVSGVKGINQANQLRLSAINVAAGESDLLASIGGKVVAEVTDPNAGELAGRAAGVSVGSAKSSVGAIASIDDVVVRVPSPF